MKQVLILVFAVTLFFVQSSPNFAAAKPKKTSVPSVSASVQYIKAKNVARLFFGNLKGIAKITYILTYQGNGIVQGIEGSFSLGKKTFLSKDLYLGTCSGKACVQHNNIKNIQLKVTTKYTNGKSSSKIYKVK